MLDFGGHFDFFIWQLDIGPKLFSRPYQRQCWTSYRSKKGSRKERWISERSWKLIDERKSIKIARDQTNSDETWKINNAEYEKKDKEVKKSYKSDQRKWVEDKGREAEEAPARSDSKTLYRIVRDLTGSRNITNVTIKSRNGKVLLTAKEQSSRWVEHFNEVLNQDSPTDMFDFREYM